MNLKSFKNYLFPLRLHLFYSNLITYYSSVAVYIKSFVFNTFTDISMRLKLHSYSVITFERV